LPDPSHAGRRYLAPGQVVDAERVGRFAAAVGGEGGPFQPGSVPPTFAAVYCLMPALAQLFADPELGLELAGLIHAEQSFEWPAPIRPGETLDASAEIVSVERKRGMTFVTVGIQASNRAGETVCRGSSLLLIRGGER
jgi:hypothetical protein